MAGFPGPDGPWPAIRRDLERPNRRRVIAVVAYVAGGAPDLMPLRSGDILVCDASKVAVKSRMTSSAALAVYEDRGVSVYSVAGLHAKVIASPTAAWIGSANASKNSKENLIEASVKVSGDQAQRLYRWALSQATDDRALSAADIKMLKKLKLAPFRAGPRRETRPVEVPRALTRLRLIETTSTLTRSEANAIERDRAAARAAARTSGLPSELSPVYSTVGSWLREGEWVIDIRNGRVRTPAQVVRIASDGHDQIAWLSHVKTVTRPSIAQLRMTVAGVEAGFEERMITGRAGVEKVLTLFR